MPLSENTANESQAAETCYMCSKISVSVDHVPARGFFPAAKDSKPILGDLRKDLLTVPACLEHNGLYSDDEEYVIYVISLFLKNHPQLIQIQLSKFLRASDRAPGKRKFFGKKGEKLVLVRHGRRMVPGYGNTIDLARYDLVMDKIGRGLFYLVTKKQQKLLPDRKLEIVSPDMATEFGEMPFDAMTNYANERIKWEHLHTHNPEVFQCFYYFHNGNTDSFIFELIFYEGFRVWIMPQGNRAELPPRTRKK